MNVSHYRRHYPVNNLRCYLVRLLATLALLFLLAACQSTQQPAALEKIAVAEDYKQSLPEQSNLGDSEYTEAYRTYYMQMHLIDGWVLNRQISIFEENQLKALASDAFEKNTQKPIVKYERDERVKQILASNELHRQCLNKIDTYLAMKRVDKEIFYSDSKKSLKPPLSETMKTLSAPQKQALREMIILNVECRQTRLLSLEGLTRFYNRDKSYHNAMDVIFKQLLSEEITIDEANTRFHRARKYWLRIEEPEGKLS